MSMKLVANKQLTGVYGTVAANEEFEVADDKLAKHLMATGLARSATAKPIHDSKMKAEHENKGQATGPITSDTLFDRSGGTLTGNPEMAGVPHAIPVDKQPEEALKPFEAARVDQVDDKDAEQAGFRGSASDVPMPNPKQTHVSGKSDKGVSGADVPKSGSAHTGGRAGHKPSHSK